MAGRACFLVFLPLLLSMSVVRCWDNAMDRAKEELIPDVESGYRKVEELRHKASDKLKEVTEETQSRTNGAGQKISEGLGTAGRAADKGKDKAKDTASGAANLASEKACDASTTLIDGKDRATVGLGEAKHRATDTAGRSYEEAKQKLGEAFEMARTTMTEQTKANYEAAKEKASQAAGQYGPTIYSNGSEL